MVTPNPRNENSRLLPPTHVHLKVNHEEVLDDR